MCDSENTDNAFSEMNTKGGTDIWRQVDHGWLSLEFSLFPNTLVLKKGMYYFNTFLVLVSFLEVIFGLVLLSMVPYDAFPHYQLMSTGVFLQSLFKVIILIVLGYSLGQSGITGTTKMFGWYLYAFSLGILAYGIGWSLQTSLIWWLHWLGYILIGLSLLCFAYGVKCWFQHKEEVGDWKDIGDLVLRHDPFLSYDDALQGDSFAKDPFQKHHFLIIKSANEVKLYERQSIVPESVYQEILRKKKIWFEKKCKNL
jgi:hypothetical protein